MALVDTGPMLRKADQAADSLASQGSFVWVYGGQGTGRDVVLDALRTRFPEQLAVVRMAPLSSPDAIAHARLQLAILAREEHAPLELISGSTVETLASSLERLQKRERILVLRMHPTWEEPGAVEQTLWDGATNLVRQLGIALRNTPFLRVLILAGSHRRAALRDLGQRAQYELNLAVPELDVKALDDDASWRTLRDDFLRLRAGLTGSRPTPPQLRLGVALVALGDSAPDIARQLRSLASQEHAQLQPLLQRLRLRLSQHERAPVLRRAAFARFALPWSHFLSAVPELEDVADLVRLGLGYETDGRVRLSEPVRRTLLSEGLHGERLTHADLDTHARFEQTWAQFDGVSTPEQLTAPKVIPWLEKMHHRAHAGGPIREQLESLDLPAREFYWDLGRALSREQGRFEDAALVYQRCWQKFPHDDYAHHYYAWNLDRAGRQPKDVETHYESAIQENPHNVWWHARLCTFLIQQTRFRDAEDAFRQALMTLDPNEVEVRRDARFARSLHRWVVEAWLGMGEVDRASEVFSLVPNEVVIGDSTLRLLGARVADAVEATELGESVYPASILPEQRWTLPTFVPDEEEGSRLVAWRPGRVRRVDELGVELVFVEAPEEPHSRELRGIEFSHAEWRAAARGRAAQLDTFVIFAEYEGGPRRLFHWPPASLDTRGLAMEEELDSLRYVRQWLGGAETSAA